MTTVTKNVDLRDALNSGMPDSIAKAEQAVKRGNMTSLIKVTFAALASAAAQDITTAAAKAAGTISGITLQTGELLPAIGQVLSLRVTAGAAAAGPRVVVDTGGTAGAPGANGPGIARISDDGKTLTFEAAVTGFVLQYYPRADVALTTEAPPGAPF